MNSLHSPVVEGDWQIAKGKLKQRYVGLTDDDLCYVEGREDALIGRLLRVTGAPRDELERFLDDECSGL
jgi:uncharacterized protein YjbJ (UPF0337 family)